MYVRAVTVLGYYLFYVDHDDIGVTTLRNVRFSEAWGILCYFFCVFIFPVICVILVSYLIFPKYTAEIQ